jgi:serine/threonine protein kinase/DNA-binding beta-propeller fold protein YncE/class 3 adenylate cyclase
VEPSAFAVLLRQHRVEAGLTQEELAERAGLSTRAVSDLERGVNRRPQAHTARQLADALGLRGEPRAAFTAAARDRGGAVALLTEPGEQGEAVPVQDGQTAGIQTFLIADIRGYTHFTLQQGDEGAARLATRFAAISRDVVSGHQGQIIEVRGDEVLAVFSSARQALRAATVLQERFAAQTEREPELPLQVGIGLDVGEAVPVEGGYRGAALNLAARLCSLAGPGEVLASDGVTHLTGRTEGLAYIERGPVELKGIVEPVRVVQVVPGAEMPEGRAAAHDAMSSESEPVLPIGGFVGSLPSRSIVARDEEVRAIMAAIEAAVDGTGQLILLGGEPGVGKTRLAQEATLIAHKRGFCIAAGRCYEAEQSVPFFPFREALGMAYSAAPASAHFQVPRRWPQLAHLLPEWMALPVPADSLDSQEEQQRVIRAGTAFFSALTEDRPVALFLDDLHWADGASLRFLAHLARQTRGRRLFILGTYRETVLGTYDLLDRTLRELARERLVERMAARRLMPEGTAAMVASIVGDMEMSEEFTGFVHRRTKGLPAYIEELLRSLGGRYRLVREIGAGGMGRVFQAVDTQTGTPVAAKIMFASGEAGPEATLRFEQEGAVLATLEHPNIVRVHGTFMQEHASCIIMELLAGRSLAEVLRSEPLGLARTKRMAQQVAAALAAAHKQGVVHRDIKPANIMVTPDDQVKVTDFGIARVLRPEATIHTMTSTGMTLGTPLYMAPEQIQGKNVDGRADIYAVGAVLYHMLTGRPPFEADDPLTLALKHLQEEPLAPTRIRQGLPGDWDALVLTCLAKNPADRFQSAEALETAVADLSTEGVTPETAGPSDAVHGATSTPHRLLRVLTPPARPRAGGTGRVAGREPLPPSAERNEVATAPVSPQWRARDLLRSRRVQVAVAAIGLVALIAGLVARIPHTPTTSATLQPRAIWVGQAPGRFQNPDGVAVDARGNLYVADQLTNRIQKLSPAGLPLAEWGGLGSGPGQFAGPAGVAVDRQGDIYVADTGNNRIQKLSPMGKPLQQWGQAGTGPGQFSTLLGLAVDAHGIIYVADAGNSRIQVLSSHGRLLRQWGAQGSGLFRYPDGVAVDTNGHVFVTDGQSGRVQEFSPTGQLLRRWGGPGSKPGSLNAPTGVAVDRSGNVYVADQLNNTVQKFSGGGKLLARWGGTGSAPGRFQSPQALAVDALGHVYVADSRNHRIQQLTAAGKPLREWTVTGTGLTFTAPTGLAVDAAGGLYVVDNANNGRLYKLTSSGQLDPRWQMGLNASAHQDSGVAVGPSGAVYVTDQLNSSILVLSSTGRQRGSWLGPPGSPLYAPSGVTTSRGAIYVADTGNDRIVKLSAAGSVLAQWGTPGAGRGQFASPAGVAVDTSGTVYAVDSRNDTVQKFSPRGGFLSEWGGSGSAQGQLRSPSAVAMDTHGHVYVADTGNNRIQEFSADGSFIRLWGTKGSLPGQFRSIGGLTVDSRGNVYVADTGNHRIQTFSVPR